MSNSITHSIFAKKITSPVGKMIGLLGKKIPEPIMFTTFFGIHTYGMQFPIDVLVLNNQNQVMQYKEVLLPNKLFFWNPRYRNIIELPAHSISRMNIKKFDTITVTNRV